MKKVEEVLWQQWDWKLWGNTALSMHGCSECCFHCCSEERGVSPCMPRSDQCYPHCQELCPCESVSCAPNSSSNMSAPGGLEVM